MAPFVRPSCTNAVWLRLVPAARVFLCLALAAAAVLRAQTNYATPYTFTAFAGRTAVGTADGTGPAARFYSPMAVAADSAGNLYVADTGNNTIRKITPSGVVTTLAGSPGEKGTADGTGADARFNYPRGVCVDSAGNVYVADSQNYTIRKITPVGVVTTLAGVAGFYGYAETNTEVYFSFPSAVAVDGAGNIYVGDGNAVRKLTGAGGAVTIAGSAQIEGTEDGPAADARFSGITGIQITAAGVIYVIESNRQRVRRIAVDGTVSTFAGLANTTGTADGTGTDARFFNPGQIALDHDGNLYVADSTANTIRKITPAAVVTTLAGAPMQSGSDDGAALADARFFGPAGITVDGAGNLFVADAANHKIRKITPAGGVSTFAGAQDGYGSADGLGSAAQFSSPRGVAFDSKGNCYVTDTGNRTIRKITPAGEVTTFAGMANAQVPQADGTAGAARFAGPSALAFDANDNLYVTDVNTVRKITPAGDVTTYAGSVYYFDGADGVGIAAHFSFLYGIAVDPSGNVFVADSFNYTIRKIAPDRTVTTLAGTPGVAGTRDGTGADALFNYPSRLAIDSAGNLYASELVNYTVRKITPAGVVTTLAGSHVYGSDDGTGFTVRFRAPAGLAVDPAGNVYVGDANTIRRISPAGVVTTVAGTPGQPMPTDGTGPAAGFQQVDGLAFDAGGNLFAVDSSSNLIRKGVPPPTATTFALNATSLTYTGSAQGPTVVATPAWATFTAGGTLTATNVGDYTMTATATGNYTGGNNSLTWSIAKATPVITWPTPPAITYGTALSGTQLNATANVAGAFAYNPASGTVLSAGTHTLDVTFTPADSTNYRAVTVQRTLTVNKAQAVISLGGQDIFGDGHLSASWDGTAKAITAWTQGVVTTYSGAPGSPGSTDGPGNTALFNFPGDVVADAAGNVYVADTSNGTIRKITPAGAVTTFAGNPAHRAVVDGPAGVAGFFTPETMAIDGAGNLYVADRSAQSIRKISPAGVVTTLAGFAYEPGSADGTGSAARFRYPQGVAVDGAGTVYVSDGDNHTIRKITPTGEVTTFAGGVGVSGFADGTGNAARFAYPRGLAVDGAGNVYVTDSSNYVIRMISPTGAVSTIAGQAGSWGTTDGVGSAARFSFPYDVSVDGAGNLYVADGDNIIRKIVPGTGYTVTTLAGNPSAFGGAADGTGSAARFLNPHGLFADNGGTVYVADTDNHQIRKVSPVGVVTTLAGMLPSAGADDGPVSSARFGRPWGVTRDNAGNLYISESNNCTIRKISPAGVVSTLAGTAPIYGWTDGTGNAARFGYPAGIAIDSAGDLYVADEYTHTIRKVTSAGVVTTIAGSPFESGSADGTGAAARFNHPDALAVDSTGNVYVADWYNNTIRKVTPAGVVTTIAGTAGLSGIADGIGANARLSAPRGIAVDAAGCLYVTNALTGRIRKITPDSSGTVWTVTTLAPGTDFYSPTGIAVDPTGNIYVTEVEGNTIRRIAPDGTVTTLAGTNHLAGEKDGVGGAAQFYCPTAVAIDAAGDLFVTDSFGNTIRKVSGVRGTFSVMYDGDPTPPTLPGSYTVVATLNDPNNEGSVTDTLVIYPANQPAPVFTSATSTVFGHSYTATTSTGFGATQWSVRPESTANGAAIDPATGVVSFTSAGTVVLWAWFAGDGNHGGSGLSIFTLTVNPAPTVRMNDADFNGDGQSDILWQNTTTGQRYVWFMDGTTNITGVSLGVVDLAWSMVGSADFNGDGHPDILWQNTTTGQRYVWFMDGTYNITGVSLGVVDLAWSMVGTADFNGDGKPDILWQNTTTGQRYVWFMDGTYNTTGVSLGVVDLAWSIVGTADFNSDGHPDILWENTTTGQRYVWFMDGTYNTTGVSLGVVDLAWSIVGAADYNGDGKPDILWQNTTTGQRYIWIMDGTYNTTGVGLGVVDLSWSAVN